MMLDRARWIVQWLTLLCANFYLGFVKTKQVYQGALKGACVPFLNCHSCPSALFSCPIGVGQHFMTLHKIPYILIGYLSGIGILFGSMACGWLCPFGFLQDLLYRIRSLTIRIPRQLSVLRYFVLLFLVILIPIVTQKTWFSKLCPMGTLQAALPWSAWNPVVPVYNEPVVATEALGFLFTAKIVIAVLILLMAVVAKRPFCRTLCPLGAVFGFFNKFSLVRLKVDATNCSGCNKCAADCPVDLNVSEHTNAPTCVRCLRCLKCKHVSLDVGGLRGKVDLLK
jgi:polyferredoxin